MERASYSPGDTVVDMVVDPTRPRHRAAARLVRQF